MAGGDPSFLGRGWSFPPAFSRGAAAVEMVSGPQDIQQSLQILLSTRPGERVMVAEYGCDLSRFVFENVTTTLLTRIADMVERAIILWEPRIRVDHVTTEVDPAEPALIQIDVAYTVRATNTRSNFVYPFYLREATIAPPAP
jgi:phage baseplate assembly protein W